MESRYETPRGFVYVKTGPNSYTVLNPVWGHTDRIDLLAEGDSWRVRLYNDGSIMRSLYVEGGLDIQSVVEGAVDVYRKHLPGMRFGEPSPPREPSRFLAWLSKLFCGRP
jgi:hypothetical protein